MLYKRKQWWEIDCPPPPIFLFLYIPFVTGSRLHKDAFTFQSVAVVALWSATSCQSFHAVQFTGQFLSRFLAFDTLFSKNTFNNCLWICGIKSSFLGLSSYQIVSIADMLVEKCKWDDENCLTMSISIPLKHTGQWWSKTAEEHSIMIIASF